jgi:DNA invertase Pin-like site-specific DNA recombinase
MNNDLPVAVVYYRCSTSKQDTSVATQRARVGPHFAAKYRLAEEYVDDGKSGSKDTEKRVDFLRMVHDLSIGKHAGKVQAVLCLDTSRFGRLNTIRGAKYKEALMDAGVVLDTVTDGLIDWRTGVGRIVDTVRAEGNHETALLIAEKGLAGRIRVTKWLVPQIAVGLSRGRRPLR